MNEDTRLTLMSSNKMDWRTPKKLFNNLNDFFNFDFDPCPINPDFDGLNISWGKRNFVNPPYGREIKHWIKKGFKESCLNKLVIFLIPSRTDTQYWHDYIMKSSEIWFIKGRLKFSDCGIPAPFPSCIVVFNGINIYAPIIKKVNILGNYI